jgi:hypothetical protein
MGNNSGTFATASKATNASSSTSFSPLTNEPLFVLLELFNREDISNGKMGSSPEDNH